MFIKNEIINKLKNKGFTLIELLAVIVVLSIIALIGYSSIGNVINVSKQKAATESARNYIKALDLKLVSDMASGVNTTDGIYAVEAFEVAMEGTNPTSGTVEIANSKVIKATLIVDEFQFQYDIATGVTILEQEIRNYPNGTVVFFNPTTMQKCNDYVNGNSVSYNVAGCLKWYAYLETSTTVNLLLDHNIDENIEFWSIDFSLDYQTQDWNSSLQKSVISVYDVLKIINSSTVTTTSLTDYSWLYVNINGGIYPGYWTSTASDIGGGWAIADGKLIPTTDNYKQDGWRGVRPTITINKSLLNS